MSSTALHLDARRVEMWFDVVCPYAYLGSTQIAAVAARHGAEVVWKPFLLGGVLVARGVTTGDANAVLSPARARHNLLDLQRWAETFGVPLRFPPGHPRRTVLAMRAIVAVGDARAEAAGRALFAAYWERAEDVSDAAVVVRALDAVGIDGAACVERAESPEIKAELRTRTDDALALGVFGAPTFFVGGEMFWGQDRLDFVERALVRGRPESHP